MKLSDINIHKLLVLLVVGLVWVLTSSNLAQASLADNEALIEAASKGNVQKVQALLAKGAEINYQRKDGSTALMVASVTVQGAVAKVLLESGGGREHQKFKGGNGFQCRENR